MLRLRKIVQVGMFVIVCLMRQVLLKGGGGMTFIRAVHITRFRAVRESVQRERPVGKSYHLHTGDDSVSG